MKGGFIIRTYNIFISHAWQYGDSYDRLVALLDNASCFSYKNFSAPEDNPLTNTDGTPVTNKSQITSAIENKIKLVHCVVVISGMYYNNKEWMEKEIEIAQKYDKPIIAVKPWGNTKMPTEVQDVADTTVNWNTDSIVDAIKTYSLD
ncbi:MAG: TIR domain-containing protein [Ruminococcus bovis]|nr:TIR domain-containing protein [Ruminococcus bovis]MDY3661768.1 TIR domain-containing protein [Ruminococcus bovis]